jgi:hypothetical protein
MESSQKTIIFILCNQVVDFFLPIFPQKYQNAMVLMYGFFIDRKFKMATTTGYILHRTYNVKINKMIFELDLIEHKLAYEYSRE